MDIRHLQDDKDWNLIGPAQNNVALAAKRNMVGPNWYWDGTRLDTTDTLMAGVGYWLYAIQPTTIEFVSR